MSSSLIPVHVLTGFLGSGKTSLLRKLLSDPQLGDTAVVINEFGEVGLDHLLVRGLTEDIVLLSSGCVCCALSDDLSATLADLCRARMAGEIPAFARVVLETTGLADPLPIIRLLRMDSRLKSFFAVGQVVTTVDAVNALHTMEIYDEAMQQVAAADSLIITKTDMATEVGIERILQHVIAINPTARRLSYGRSDQPDSNELFGRSGEANRDRTGLVSLQQSDHLATSAAGISTFVISLDKSVDLDSFIDWLDLLLASRGDSILRVKGYLAANGYHTPLLIQGVQHILDRPEPMQDWAERGPPTLLVFIAKHVTKTAIERSIKSLLATSCN